MSTPFFSVIIPTYNRAEFIGATLESVRGQQFTDWEVMVVDDGSTDNTAGVMAAMADPRIQYWPKLNGERGAARNYGLLRARGRYVIFLDSDDQFLPQHLSILHDKIEALEYPNFIASKYQFNRNGLLTDSDLVAVPEGWYGLDFFVRGNALACNFCALRQNPDLKIFEEDRRYAAVEDWMFLLENTQQDRVYIIDAVTLIMNDHDQRSMRADNSGLIQRLELATEWMRRLQLTDRQRQDLLGHVQYLCAIHCYMDGHRGEALRHWRQAWGATGWRRGLPLLARILLGPAVMNRIKRVAS